MKSSANFLVFCAAALVIESGSVVAQVAADANWDDRFGPSPAGLNGVAYAVAISGTDVYVGGQFTMAGGVSVSNIAKWDGNSWSDIGGGVTGPFGSGVYAIAANGSDLYVGGSFTNAGGLVAFNIAKWNGTSWSPVGIGTSSSVHAIAVNSTDVYVGGSFTAAGGPTNAGGVFANNIAKWDGAGWSALGSGVTGNVPIVAAIAVSGNDVYVGGVFSAAGAGSANNVAKWDSNTSTWSALGNGIPRPGPGSPVNVNAIAISGTNVYVGGSFSTLGGSPGDNIAKWDGASWSAVGGGLISAVGSGGLAIGGNDLYAAGIFTQAGGVSASKIAKWDGSTWSALGSGLSFPVANAVAYGVAVSSNNVYVGGNFDTAGGKPSLYFAHWTIPGPPAAPTKLRAIAQSGSVVYLTWKDNSTDETKFRLQRALAATGPWTTIANVGANVVTYSDTTVSAGTTYFYRVFAINPNGKSPKSNVASSTPLTTTSAPAAPTSLVATANSSTQIDLTWTDNANNECGFKILRGVNAGGPFPIIATVGANITTFSDNTATPGTTWYYKVRAINPSGNSPPSNVAIATTPP